MNGDLGFFVTTMPDSRPADYHLGCLEGSVFLDFDNCDDERICLVSISFDGYGAYILGDQAIAMDKIESQAFKKIIATEEPDQPVLATIVRKTLMFNRELISEEALKEYGLL